jgi:hypothetical protein
MTYSRLTKRLALPPSVTREAAVALLHNHDFILRLDPEFIKYEERSGPRSDETREAGARYYTVTDVMTTLPHQIWESTVQFDAQLTNLENGVRWLIHAPLGLVQMSDWMILQVPEDDSEEERQVEQDRREEGRRRVRIKPQLFMVQDGSMKCNLFLARLIKSKVDENATGMNRKILEALVGDAASLLSKNSDASKSSGSATGSGSGAGSSSQGQGGSTLGPTKQELKELKELREASERSRKEGSKAEKKAQKAERNRKK